ncbi:adenosine deaminase [Streptomyces hokutonensis]|uniref:adenosine deaminase n=1 Tax=Streptomyces hokutonensis TaxID=1306990 RepID=UPI00380FE7E0
MPVSLRDLPKAHLHVHLAATMRHTTLLDFAGEDGVAPPRVNSYTDFSDFLRQADALCGLLNTPARALRLIAEAVEDAAGEGAVAVEFSFDPPSYGPFFGNDDTAVREMAAALREAAAEQGIWAGFILAADRGAGSDAAIETARLAEKYQDSGVIGLGLQGDEAGHPTGQFAAAFDLAHEAGLLCLPHAGEFDGPASVRAAIDDLHADRVQHGIRAIEDGELLRQIVEREICLDVCPTSNVALHVVRNLRSHPLPTFLARGVKCSINADDPALFGVGILGEYDLCRSGMALSDDDLAACARNSIVASAAPRPVKDAALAGVQRWLTASV